MATLTQRQIITQLLKLFNDPNVTSDSSLYDPPFGFDANSLQVFLDSEVDTAFGVSIRVDELGDPPTFGSLVAAILKDLGTTNAKAISAFTTALVKKTRPKNYAKGK